MTDESKSKSVGFFHLFSPFSNLTLKALGKSIGKLKILAAHVLLDKLISSVLEVVPNASHIQGAYELLTESRGLRRYQSPGK